MTKPLIIDLGERSYPIWIGEGILAKAEIHWPKRVLVITDENLAPLYGQWVLDHLPGAKMLSVPAGESSKSLAMAESLYTQAIEAGVDRHWGIVALGGGVVGDLAGFVAATLYRGLAFYQIPTSLLAQVDSSVGGKVGINHPLGKNLIGAFHQPQAVLADPQVLQTLPVRELKAGLAEVVKHACLGSAELFQTLEDRLDQVMNLDPELMSWIIKTNCQIKGEVVRSDERESGQRAVLNLGHTVGHGVEVVAGFGTYLHGEAVSIGLVSAYRLARELGQVGTAEVERVESLLHRIGLPTQLPVDVEAVMSALGRDKKAVGGVPFFVLPQGIGRAQVGVEIPAHLVRKVLGGQVGTA